MELSELFPGLFSAAFRGVEFYMPDSRHEIGRRTQRFLFPGRDDTIDEDLGALDGPIHVTGLLLGDDYIAQARAMERAFRTPGPGTLSHPWLGELEVVLASPGTITFDDRKLRVASFEASFLVWRERTYPAADTLTLVLERIAALKAAVKAMLRQVLAPLAMPLAAVSYTRGFATAAVATWRGVLLSGTGMSALAADTASALAGLAALGNIPVRTTLPDEVADGLSAVPQAVAGAATLLPTAAIGGVAPAPAADPAVAAQLLLDTALAWAGPVALPSPAPALHLAARMLTLAEAADAAAAIAFDSQPQARGWHAGMDAAIAAAAADAATVAAGLPLAAGPVWREASALRRAVAADMAQRIGRLPQVARLSLPVAAPAWLVAQHIAGDDPAAVETALLDLVRRNRIRQPGLVAPGELEVLRPADAPVAWISMAAPADAAAEEAPAAGGSELDSFVLDVSRLG